MTTGETQRSNPTDRDERAFCLLRSQRVDYSGAMELADGWYGLEEGRWRWTHQSFAARVAVPRGINGGAQLILRFYLPDFAFRLATEMSISATVNGVTLSGQRYTDPGEHLYAAAIPMVALQNRPLLVRFTLDKVLLDGIDQRPLGVVIGFSGRPPILVAPGA